jgi:hypothetical protein
MIICLKMTTIRRIMNLSIFFVMTVCDNACDNTDSVLIDTDDTRGIEAKLYKSNDGQESKNVNFMDIASNDNYDKPKDGRIVINTDGVEEYAVMHDKSVGEDELRKKYELK